MKLDPAILGFWENLRTGTSHKDYTYFSEECFGIDFYLVSEIGKHPTRCVPVIYGIYVEDIETFHTKIKFQGAERLRKYKIIDNQLTVRCLCKHSAEITITLTRLIGDPPDWVAKPFQQSVERAKVLKLQSQNDSEPK